jgi:hypothetical protein
VEESVVAKWKEDIQAVQQLRAKAIKRSVRTATLGASIEHQFKKCQPQLVLFWKPLLL